MKKISIFNVIIFLLMSCSSDDEVYSPLEFTKVEITDLQESGRPQYLNRYGRVRYGIKGNIDKEYFKVYFTVLKNENDTITTIERREQFIVGKDYFNESYLMFLDEKAKKGDVYRVVNERIEW